MTTQTQLDHLCRLCLKKADSLEDIFENNDSSSLVLRIMACVSLEVHKTDNLPKRICSPCRYQLEKTYIFRSKCRDNDTKLRRHVKLLAAGKVSMMLEELDDDDEDEFESSLQFIKAIDEMKEGESLKELERKILAHETKLRADWELEEWSIREEAEREALRQRRDNMVDVGIETCHLSEIHQDGEYEEEPLHTEPAMPEQVAKPCVSFSKDLEISSVHSMDHKVEDTEIEYESIEEEPTQDDDNLSEIASVDVKRQLRAKIHARFAKEDEEMISYLEDSTLMEVDGLEDGEENASSITVLNEELQPSCSESDSMANQENHEDSERFVITAVSDSDTYILENELSQEEHNLYDTGDDSDEDLEAVTNAVKAELAEQPGFNIGENCIMKVEKDRDLTKVEVRANDGSIICMEFSTEPKKKVSSSLRTLQARMKGEFKCPHCSTKFKSPKILHGHIKASHPENSKGHVCDVCAKWCPTKSSLERHYRTHTGERPFICGECGRSFIQKEILKRHMLVHTDEKPYFCESCSRRFNQKDQLRHHVNMAHTPNPIITIHKCNLCDKEFKYASGLSRHLASHYGRTFPCECGKVFSDKSALKRHEWGIHGKGKKQKDPAATAV
ncbi:zinc finger protein 813-like [Ochlerotatus camptorhynchus]|uniref:zinc finger protein 813-like n=1 Tax=Ochlerotatus camptorhynchus TaxID=644619 RepID=UPI0031E3C38D